MPYLMKLSLILSVWLPIAFNFSILIVVLFLLIDKFGHRRFISFKRLIYAVLIFYLIFAFFLSSVQYYFWKSDAFGRLFLPPHQSMEYFIQYSFFHFWQSLLLGFFSALVFTGCFFVLKKINDRLIGRHEIELFFLLAVISGWPNIIFFLSVSLLISTVWSLSNYFIFRKTESSFVLPFFIAGIITFIFGNYFVYLSGLSVLKLS